MLLKYNEKQCRIYYNQGSIIFVKNICVCVERRHEYKQKSNYRETMKGNLPYFYIKENFENTRGIRIYTSKDIPRNIDALNERFYEMSREVCS